jgi:hypothetical protein
MAPAAPVVTTVRRPPGPAKDKRTLWTVIRTDSCDGDPSHRTLPYLTATSTDGGRSAAIAERATPPVCFA